MSPKYAAAVTLIAAAGFFSGYGGGGDGGKDASEPPVEAVRTESDAKAVLKVSRDLSSAYMDRDARGVCRLLDPGEVEKQIGSPAKCVKRMKKILERVDAKPFRIKTVDPKENGAVVTYRDNPPGTVSFVKIDDRWYADIGDKVPRD